MICDLFIDLKGFGLWHDLNNVWLSMNSFHENGVKAVGSAIDYVPWKNIFPSLNAWHIVITASRVHTDSNNIITAMSLISDVFADQVHFIQRVGNS